MLRKNSLLLLFFFSHLLYAQDIPQNRLSNWSNCGLTASVDNSAAQVDVVSDLGLSADSSASDNSLKLNSAINESTVPTTLFFPSGVFLFLDPIVLKSNITLAGSGTTTKLVFDEIGETDCIKLHGKANKDTTLIKQGQKGDNYIVLQNTRAYSANDILLIADTDSNDVFSSWAFYTTGQLLRVKSQSNDTLFLYNSLRRSYTAARNPFIVTTNPLSNSSIENLSILRLDESVRNTSNIGLNYTYNCLVQCIVSERCDFAHISSSKGLHNSIVGNYLTKAADYGGGGSGYGIVLQSTSSECLVSSNICRELRHSMLLQSGANGNVISYNYSSNPYWEGTTLPSDAAGDLVFHGNYPYANLCEGNVVQNLVIDESHGINGPHNVFFRNRAESYGIVMNSTIATDSQLFIGNETTNSAIFKGLYVLAGDGHYQYGNNIKGAARPAGTSSLSLSSLYLASAPTYEQSSTWPAIGFPNTLAAATINAELRTNASQLTLCDTARTSGSLLLKVAEPNIYPNPCTGILHISDAKKFSYYQLIDLSGREIKSGTVANRLDFNGLVSGVYHLVLMGEQNAVERLVITH